MEQGWELQRDYQLGNTVGDLSTSATSKAEEILKAGRDWKAELKVRNEVREMYTDEETKKAVSWIEKQKKEIITEEKRLLSMRKIK